jgi:hypothetical protein
MLLVGGGFFGRSTMFLLLGKETGTCMGFSGRVETGGVGQGDGGMGSRIFWVFQFEGDTKNSQGMGKTFCTRSGGSAALAIEFTHSEDESDEVCGCDSLTKGGEDNEVSMEKEGSLQSKEEADSS